MSEWTKQSNPIYENSIDQENQNLKSEGGDHGSPILRR